MYITIGAGLGVVLALLSGDRHVRQEPKPHIAADADGAKAPDAPKWPEPPAGSPAIAATDPPNTQTRSGEPMFPSTARFASEARDPHWAADFERRIGDKLALELKALDVPGEVKNLECRASMCAFRIEVPSLDLNELMSWSDIVWLGDMSTLGDIEQPDARTATLHIILEFSPEHREPADYERAYKERREQVFARRNEEAADGP